MEKKITAMIFAIVLCFCAPFSVFAADADGFSNEYYRLNDLAQLLSESEQEDLLKKLDEISVRQKMDVTVATSEGLDEYNTVSEYADALYEYCDFGYGKSKDGLLLLINIKDNDWYISTCGYGITAFTDAGIQYIGEQIKPDLSDGNFAAAFDKYADLCDEFITQARTGEPFDSANLPRKPLSLLWIPGSILIGVVLALIVVGIMKSKLKTVRFQAAANNYVKKDSLNITQSKDLFLYQTVTRTEKPKDDSSSGSSTHTSSSGTTHGGGGGKF